MNINELNIGTKVHYQPSHFNELEWENGIVKEIRESKTDGVWVVYNCNNDWKHYKEYTSALTDLQDLKIGWRFK